MAARITIERVLRDEDDASGQSVRDWKIEAERGFVTIQLKYSSGGFLLLRTDDVNQFVIDLNRAKDAAVDLADEEKTVMQGETAA